MDTAAQERTVWRLATESIVVRIRWFGVAVGFVLVHARDGLHDPEAVRWFLALGASYAFLDTLFFRSGRVFLGRWPLFVSAMESIFIGLLCYHDIGLESPFRWYYLLSLICAAIRYPPSIAWWTFGFDCLSLFALTWGFGLDREAVAAWSLTVVILAWATGSASALASLLKATGERLRSANAELQRHRTDLERRVEERTEALRASQARVLHQEKMAAFGLLAAGIAHEVGNPLAALSSLVQMLQRRDPDEYTAEKLDLARRQLERIRRTIRELVDFSRPASTQRGRVRIAEVVDEALGIAKYYHRTKLREIRTEIQPDLPFVVAARDHLTQVLLNLVINAIDATDRGGLIEIHARIRETRWLELSVTDDGRGVSVEDQSRIFLPYFTTKASGTGLGLFVCRQIVEEYGGEIGLEPARSQGTCFTIRLPVEPNDAQFARLEPRTPAEGAIR